MSLHLSAHLYHFVNVDIFRPATSTVRRPRVGSLPLIYCLATLAFPFFSFESLRWSWDFWHCCWFDVHLCWLAYASGYQLIHNVALGVAFLTFCGFYVLSINHVFEFALLTVPVSFTWGIWILFSFPFRYFQLIFMFCYFQEFYLVFLVIFNIKIAFLTSVFIKEIRTVVSSSNFI